MFATIFVSIILWAVGSSITINDCPDNLEHDEHLTVFEDKCYYFYLNIKKQFQDAQEVCRQNGGNLTSVKTSTVNYFIWNRLRNDYDFDGKVWIGLSDQEVEGEYEWRDGSRMDYNNFEFEAGPNNVDPLGLDISNKYQDCVAMNSFNGEWTDLRCEDSFLSLYTGVREPFVCEYFQKPYTGPQVTKDDCPATVPRDEYLQVFHSSCYYFYLNSSQEFPTAQTTCQDHGGNLVSIKSQRVQDFIWKTLKYTYEFEHDAWIGLRGDKEDGVFVWRDGSVVDYNNFAMELGLYYHHNCVSIDSDSGHWFNSKCKHGWISDHQNYFICEFHATPKNTTTTTAETTTTPTTGTSTLRDTTTTTNTPTTLTTKITTTLTAPTPSTNMIPHTSPTTPTPLTSFSSNPQHPSSVLPKDTTSTKPPQCPECNVNCGDQGYTVKVVGGCIICKCLQD